MPKTRVAKYDNVKFLLIFLVVLGHFVERSDASAAKSAFLFIYTFHMPAFIFISGLFSKSTVNAPKLNWSKIIPYFYLFFILNFLRKAVEAPFKEKFTFSVFKVGNISWFLLAIFAFYIITFLIKNIDPKLALIMAVLMGCIIGYTDTKDILSVSRILAYYPFFLLGYYLPVEKVTEFTQRKWVKVISVAVLAALAAVCLFCLKDVYFIRPLLTGKNSYFKMEKFALWGGLIRLVYYFVCSAVICAVISVVPKRRLGFISTFGERTLGVYFWHLLIISVLFDLGVFENLALLPTAAQMGIVFACAVALTLILSLKVFSIPLNFILKPKPRNIEKQDIGT